MNTPDCTDNDWAAVLFTGEDPALAELLADPVVTAIDHREAMQRELSELLPAPTSAELAEPSNWVYYPWRRTVVQLPGPAGFRRLRGDRNRNKITAAEQARLRELKIGVVGLSVGHAIAHTLALEGVCGELRMTDFDRIELTNLNRIPATVLDHGINKAIVTARRIAELDPYLHVVVMTTGLTKESMDDFFSGLDLVIEECDSLDMKVQVRQEARRRRIPVLMETSDRGLFDVERFDLDADRPLFHGLLGDIDPDSLGGLSARDKAPHVMRILEAEELSGRMAASMVEIDNTINSWPQLGGDVQLGAATVAAAVRRIGLGHSLPSGRVRIDLDSRLTAMVDPVRRPPAADAAAEPTDLTLASPVHPLDAAIHAIRLAPSGGNAQPWAVRPTAEGVDIMLDRTRSSLMDVHFRGSYVAIGAAGFNARVAAAHHGRVARLAPFPADAPDAVLRITLATGEDRELAGQYPSMVKRLSNRSIGDRRDLSPALCRQLQHAATVESAELHLVSDSASMAGLAHVLAESDRLRYLSAPLHQQMMAELKWPGRDPLDTGIDVRTLALDATDVVKLRVARRPEVMEYLAQWKAGAALGDRTRDVVIGSSALAVVTVSGSEPVDYLRGGAAMERVWIAAERGGLGVQPISPVFLYARAAADFQVLSEPYAANLAQLRAEFRSILGLRADESTILVMRLSHDPQPVFRSERLPLTAIVAPAVVASKSTTGEAGTRTPARAVDRREKEGTDV